MQQRKSLVVALVLVAATLGNLTLGVSALPLQQTTSTRADTVVLVNSSSANYDDFDHYIEPYLDHFGVPYDELDIATTPVGADVEDYALIIVGHRQLDIDGTYLATTEQGYISDAVSAGAGLVNFDNDLSADGSAPRYQFVDDVYGFSYLSPPTGSGVTFTSATGEAGFRIDCWEDDHQDPVLTTTESSADLVEDDGLWTEFLYTSSRDYPTILAGADEEDYGLPMMHFYASGIPNGEYEILANLYTSGSGRDMRYFYGYDAANPKGYHIDTVGGEGGPDQHQEYNLGTVDITDGTFDIYVQDADILPSATDDYPFFGWAWIRLMPVGASPPEMHYITARHEAGESISTGSMTLAGVTLPADTTALAMTGNQPFLAVTTSGSGRAVQWGSYDWMSHSVKGPVYGLDDLVWRSIVWAARKPFVMQGLPNFLTMRVDDESGPFGWVDVANEFGIKPWAGLFFHNIDSQEAAHLSALTNAGQATASIHAFNGGFFYFNHSGSDWPDATMAEYYAEGTQWHVDNNIPISKFVLPHYYEFGTNVFGGLSDWGVEFVGTMMDPGNGYGAPWIMNGPYRLHETGGSRDRDPVYYADFLSVPGHPEFDGEFFNCVTEIRDDAGYEWYPSNDVTESIGRGTRQTKRAFDSMALATLFTHGQHVSGITEANWRAILDGITSNVASYDPIYVTLDHACQYVRAMHTSDIKDSMYDPDTRQVTTTFGGETDIPTMFYLFTEQGDDIRHVLVDVPTFSGSTDVVYQLAGPLDHVVVTPSSAEVVTGATQQFTAEGYDADDNPIPNLPFTWSIVNGGGTIDGSGLFTAGTASGSHANTVEASYDGVQGYASVEVVAPTLDHFTFEPIDSPQYVDIPFEVTITARDASGGLLASYDGQASLGDSTGTITPSVTEMFSGGSWTGEVTIKEEAQDVTITAEEGAETGTSAAFDVEAIPGLYEVTSHSYVQTAGEPFTVTVTAYGGTTFYCADDDHQDPVLDTFTDPDLFNDTDGEWDEFLWVGHRDYAGVFGGIPEATSGDLEPMRFYAYVPNGTYRVIANLYHSRDWRYYWGYTADAPRAYSIDVTSGPSGDFAEFDLGTVSVTNSTFELYTDYAEDLGGTAFEYFGWGWIRLEPVSAEVPINCWEDDHQDPVLATTTDPNDLNETDGEWTELLYTSSRDYPTVLAGTEEEGYGLPTMRFYTSTIPNGEYEVVANLYTSGSGRDMRYYYGYTDANPKEYYVDTVGGAGGPDQHEEYTLGTVNITDGTFEIYVQDADLIGAGTYPYFGWAWIRLVPTGLTMSSSSTTMLFDANENGIFGEPDDDVKTLVDGTFDIRTVDTTADTDVPIVATDTLGQSGSNLYTILAGAADHLEINPTSSTIPSGATVSYQAAAVDAYGNSWDVTGVTGFSIEAGAGGSWTNNDYTSENPGTWTVTGDHDGITGTASLTVEAHGSEVAIHITPQSETVTAGKTVTYQATAEDAYNNTWDVTAKTTFSIETGAGGSWSNNVYTSGNPGNWTVTAEYGYQVDTATLNVNDPPVADAAGPYAGNQNQTVTLDGSGSSDSDGSLISYEWHVDGSMVYSGPNPDYDLDLGSYGVGSHSILLTVTDDLGATDSDATSLSVSEPPNFRPRAVDDAATTEEETAVSIAVLDNDWDPDGVIVPDSLDVFDEPDHGSLTVGPTGICTYTPDPDFEGSDTFSYRVQDDDGAWSNRGEVSITVNGVNDPPVADDDTLVTDEDVPATLDPTANDSDVDGSIDPSTISIVRGPINGSVVIAAGGVVSYTPDADFHGTDSFSYTVEDDDGATSNEATVSVTVNDVNDPPVAVDDETSTEQDSPVDIYCTANDVDHDGTIDASSMTLVLAPTNGSVTIGENGLVTYTPDAGYVGNDTFTYTVQDDDGATSNAATVIVNTLAPAPEQHFVYMPVVVIGR